MNAFWLLSTLLLWNVLCEVQGGGRRGESYGIKTVQVVLADCSLSGEDRYPVLFETEETIKPVTGDENETFEKVYKTSNETCVMKCFTMKNIDEDFNINKARVTLKKGGSDTTSVKVHVELHGKPATYKIRMTGVCY